MSVSALFPNSVGQRLQCQQILLKGRNGGGQQDFARFLNIAEGSPAETEYLVMLSQDLKYLPPENSKLLLAEVSEIARMLNALRAKVDSRS